MFSSCRESSGNRWVKKFIRSRARPRERSKQEDLLKEQILDNGKMLKCWGMLACSTRPWWIRLEIRFSLIISHSVFPLDGGSSDTFFSSNSHHPERIMWWWWRQKYFSSLFQPINTCSLPASARFLILHSSSSWWSVDSALSDCRRRRRRCCCCHLITLSMESKCCLTNFLIYFFIFPTHTRERERSVRS